MKKLLVLAFGITATVGFSGGVAAQSCPDSSASTAACAPVVETEVQVQSESPAVVDPVVVPAAVATPVAAAPQAAAPAARAQLPVTGGDATSLALAGLGLVAGGAVLVSRTRSAEPTD